MSSLPQSVEVPSEGPSAGEVPPLRLVLFGLPAAGKSSLLGALYQTSDTQPVLLRGNILDRSQRLGELRQQVYFSTQPARTVEEVVPYPVEYRPMPLPGEASGPNEAIPAVLIDCDGQVAIDLLRRRQELAALSAERALAKAVLDADALLLIVDASSPVKQMEADFEEFAQFLAQMELSRGARTEVGGLPVFLVLTKCDLIARPDLPRSQWQKQIEERQRYVGERFKTFIRRRKSEQERRTFGRIDLYQAATATHQPAFVDAPTRPLEPFGVGPLFQQAFEMATHYRERRRAARRRLVWTIGLAGVVLGVLLSLLAWLALAPGSPFLPDTRTPAERLAGTPDELQARLKKLEAEYASPAFAKLDYRRRAEIEAHIQELKDYLDFFAKVYEIGWPGVIESEERLTRVRDQLKALAPPGTWDPTLAARMRAEYLRDAELLLEKAGEARRWFLRAGDRLRDLWTFREFPAPIAWREYQDSSEEELARTAHPPFTEKEPLRQGLGELTWGNVLRIDTVQRARETAERYQRQLRQVRQVAAALGLIALGRDHPAVLEIPRGVSMDQVVEKVTLLRKHYPNHRDQFLLAELPERMRPAVLQAAETNYRYLLTPAQAEILRQLQTNGGDTRAGWQQVRRWLENPKELAEWRTLAGALNALRGRQGEHDPITALAEFLGRDSFTLRLDAVEVTLPLGLELTPKAGSALEIYQPRVGGMAPVAKMPLDPESTRKDIAANQLRLVFRASGTMLTFAPGDELYATLALAKDHAVTWRSGERSSQYRFERLSLPPRLDGQREDGIQLRVLEPSGGLPTLPDLLPRVPAS